jgi:hypothetical protein
MCVRVTSAAGHYLEAVELYSKGLEALTEEDAVKTRVVLHSNRKK